MWESMLKEMISETKVGQKSWSKLWKSQMHSCEHIRFLLHKARWPLKKNVPKGDKKHAQAPPKPRYGRGKGILNTSIGWFLERGTDTCRLSIRVYAHLPIGWFSKYWKNWIRCMNCGSQKYTKQLKNCRFFHETRWFLFNAFERTGTSNCLILHFKKGTGTGGSLR